MSRSRYQDDLSCGACIHFRRHYVKTGEDYFPLHLGHCVHPRVKDRREDEHCARFEPAAEGEEPQ